MGGVYAASVPSSYYSKYTGSLRHAAWEKLSVEKKRCLGTLYVKIFGLGWGMETGGFMR